MNDKKPELDHADYYNLLTDLYMKIRGEIYQIMGFHVTISTLIGGWLLKGENENLLKLKDSCVAPLFLVIYSIILCFAIYSQYKNINDITKELEESNFLPKKGNDIRCRIFSVKHHIVGCLFNIVSIVSCCIFLIWLLNKVNQ